MNQLAALDDHTVYDLTLHVATYATGSNAFRQLGRGATGVARATALLVKEYNASAWCDREDSVRMRDQFQERLRVFFEEHGENSEDPDVQYDQEMLQTKANLAQSVVDEIELTKELLAQYDWFTMNPNQVIDDPRVATLLDADDEATLTNIYYGYARTRHGGLFTIRPAHIID